MALLLRVARRALSARSLAFCRSTRGTFLQSFSPFSTTPTQANDMLVEKKKLSHDERLALLPPSLTAFEARHGHFIMHAGFTVPKQDDTDVHPHLPPYPEVARGLRMGTTLHSLLVNGKSRRKHSHTLQALDAIGFPVDVDWEQYVWERQRLPALRVYRELYGDLAVPHLFVVPTGDARWPKETWGFRLGVYVCNVKHRVHNHLPKEQQQDLDAMNTSWQLKDLLVERLSLVAPTLKAFHARHGHFIMPENFTIPTEDDSVGSSQLPPYPEETRGQKLGRSIYRILISTRRPTYVHLLRELKAIGFPVDADWRNFVFEHQRLAALRTYVELHGDCIVRRSFVVPTGDSRWPVETWAFKLGRYVTNVAYRDHQYLTQAQLDQLDEVDFWSGWREMFRPKREVETLE